MKKKGSFFNMKNIFAKGGVEFVAVVLGITISFWIDNNKEQHINNKNEKNLLESILNDIKSIKSYNKMRSEVFGLDNSLMDYVSSNWEDLDTDSIATILSTSGNKASIHNMFFDYREFHPPISSLKMVLYDGSYNLIKSKDIKTLISRLVNTDYGFVTKNVDTEIALQIELRNTVMKDQANDVIKIIETTGDELFDRFKNGEKHIERTKEDLISILRIDYMRNYLNLKIRQRRLIMNFISNFNKTLNQLEDEIMKSLELS
tara:strand:+ start:186 stop:965 length:780 start_codon:yes stop_codon:yes gene_type:complete